ncbi:LysR family transcriptional regulator [Deinococcus deserti]|uniref:Putative transcriptional regulator, LysR family n=1 Tax=Deinococcus deserti (strain DSM 17065 / CIP 109153 / LMG 22923 / VCD115) TaxID=546414 RepID=C1CWP4_DEIDV|nr:LysR family transcriptional regulator [Deinococcus deserti]ACO46611.1 putative transcriptional regulator, LysR family [Deinococcus deserti VCD115]
MTRRGLHAQPTLSQLRALLAVADAGGFSEAAADLGVSQSSLSEAVGKLEELVGRPLLRRGPSGTRPTPAGERVLPHARQAVQAAGDAILAAQDDGSLNGSLRVASYRSAATHLLPAALAAFRDVHPGVGVSLIDSESESCGGGIRAVLSGLSDVAVVVQDETTQLHLTPLAQDEYLFVAPASRGTHPVKLSELNAQTLYLPPERDSCHQRVLSYLASEGIGTSAVSPITQDSVTLSLVSHGLGVTIMPRLALQPLPPGLVALPLPQPLMRPLALAVLPHRAGLPVIRAFTATLVSSLRSRNAPRPELTAQAHSGPLLH